MNSIDKKYVTIKSMNDKNTTFLVKDISTETLYIKKQLDYSTFQIYQHLCTNIRNNSIAYVKEGYISNGEYWVICEYVDGVSLDKILKEYGPFKEAEACDIIYQILDGLSAVHCEGLIHRDVNPNNIIIANGNKVKIVDFGIAREAKSDQNSDTIIMGTPGYAAPEQFGFTQTDCRSDIYACGVLLYELLTGESIKSKPEPSGKFSSIINKACELDPANRYQNTLEMKQDIEIILSKGTLHDVSSKKSSGKYNAKALPGFRRGKPWAMVIAVIYYLFAIASTVVMGFYSGPGLELCFSWRWFVAMILCVWTSPFVLLNFFSWTDKTFTRKWSRGAKIAIRVIFAAVIFSIGIALPANS